MKTARKHIVQLRLNDIEKQKFDQLKEQLNLKSSGDLIANALEYYAKCETNINISTIGKYRNNRNT